MDVKHNNNYRTGRYELVQRLNDNKHHYEINGVLPLVLPPILFRANTILVSYLQLIDSMFINIMKTIEKVKNWKIITTYN